jgi:hypothetical protein
MNQDSITEETKEQQIPAQSVPEFYTNAVRFIIHFYDVQLIFGVRTDPEKPIKDIAVMRMSPQHALVMSKLLEKNLRAYEKQMGKISLPQPLLEQLEELEEENSNANIEES